MAREFNFFRFANETSGIDRRYIPGLIGCQSLSGGQPAIDTLFSLPLVTPRGHAIDKIGIDITNGMAGAVCRVGIYDSVNEVAGDITPKDLVVDSGEFDASSNGVVEADLDPAVDLFPDRLYWITYLCGTDAPGVTVAGLNRWFPILGSSTNINDPSPGWTVAQSYGALPSTYPASPSFITSTPIPAPFIRVKENL